MAKKKDTVAPCRDCSRDTRHTIVAARTRYRDEPDGTTWSHDTYEMIQCGGCESVSLRHSHLWSEDGEPSTEHYPPRVSRPVPGWISALPQETYFLLQEVYSALDADSRRLALMGTRTALDMLIREKVGDRGNFEKGLQALEEQGIVGSRNRRFLAAALDAGHAAAHRAFDPSPGDLSRVLDIVENALQAAYALEDAAKQVRRATPRRRVRSRRGSTKRPT